MGVSVYEYQGPVLIFDKCVAERWNGQTTAVSKGQAITNLSYQFKKANNLMLNTNVALPGTITVVQRRA